MPAGIVGKLGSLAGFHKLGEQEALGTEDNGISAQYVYVMDERQLGKARDSHGDGKGPWCLCGWGEQDVASFAPQG